MKRVDPNYFRTIARCSRGAGATLGDTLLSIGMRRIGELSAGDWRSMVATSRGALTSPWVVGGIALAVYFFTWLVVLAESDLSLALPITALTVRAGHHPARFWLGETVSPTRWIGTFVQSSWAWDWSRGPAAISLERAAPQCPQPSRAAPHARQG